MSPVPPPAFPVLLEAATIQRRIGEMARAIGRDHSAGVDQLTVVSVIEGARPFTRHLLEQLSFRPEVREVRASSYLSGTVSSGDVRVTGADFDVRGRDVLITEDIVDTGRTVARLREHLLGAGARSVQVATLLSKPARRVVEVPVDYLGFEIEDHFVIGFGMDVDGRYRELPYIGLYDAALEPAARDQAARDQAARDQALGQSARTGS